MPSRKATTESPTETASRILAKHSLSFPPDQKPVPPEAYHDLDHDLAGSDEQFIMTVRRVDEPN